MSHSIPAAWLNFGSVLIYRNVSITNGSLVGFEQIASMDASNTDLQKHDYRIVFTGWIHSESLTGFGTYVGQKSESPATPQAMAQTLQAWLMHPRGELYLYQEGVLFFTALGVESLGSTGGVRDRLQSGAVDDDGDITETPQWSTMALMDVENGPKPVSCSVTYVAGFKSFQIQYEIRASIVKCDAEHIALNPSTAVPTTNPTPDVPSGTKWDPAVLTNRYSVSDSRDENLLTTRTISGKLVVRSYTQPAMVMRHMCIPPQPRGYQRTKLEFLQSPDGLSLVYSITDVQRYAAPPLPAIAWRATHSESIQKFGHEGVSTISIWMRGAINTPKSQLFTAAMKVIEHRLGKMNIAGATVIPINTAIVDTLHEPEIQVSVQAKRIQDHNTPGVAAKRYANMVFASLGKLPAVNAVVTAEGGAEATLNDAERDDLEKSQYNRDRWPTPVPYDSTIPYTLIQAYLQSPCIGYHGIPDPKTTTYAKKVVPGDSTYVDPDDPENPVVTVYVGETTDISVPEDSTSQFNPEHLQNLYTAYEIDSKYVTDHGIQAAPLAKPQATPTSAQVVAIQVAHPVTYRDVWIKGVRGGEMPLTPQAPATTTDTNGILETLIYSNVAPSPPKMLANGQQYQYEIEVFYRYMLSRTPTSSEKLRAGSLPWDITQPIDNEIALSTTQSNTII